MQKRVLFITHSSVLGGAELSLLDLATAYRQTSEVLLFAHGPFEDRLREREINITVLEASKNLLDVKTNSRLATLRSIPDLIKLAYRIAAKAQAGFDVIHINSQKAMIAAALASRIRKLPPMVWHLRDILTASHFSSLNRSLAIFLANRCMAKVIANSQATATAFASAGGNPDLVEVVYNGIALEPFEELPVDRVRQLRQELGIDDAPTIGIFSRLSFWKGQHVVLQALEHLPEVHAVMVGDALFGETEYAAHLRSLTEELNLQNRVHWLGFRRDIPALMQACDYIVHPSTEPEPFGRVLVEGLLSGRPVIASAAGGALEIVEDGVTGRLFPPNDADALAAIVRELHANPQLARSFVQRGYDRAKQKFSFAASLESFTASLQAI